MNSDAKDLLSRELDSLVSLIALARAKAKATEDALDDLHRSRPKSAWGEDIGPVLWWVYPIEEPPYAGTPLDSGWPGYHTHWTPIPTPLPRETP